MPRHLLALLPLLLTACSTHQYADSTSPTYIIPAPTPSTETTPITPATPPAAQAPIIQLRNDSRSASVEVVQFNKTIAPDAAGIYHLQPSPFAFRIRGDLENVGLVASQSPDLPKAFANEIRPIVSLVATNSVFTDGDLFINNRNGLSPWTAFRNYLGDSYDDATQTLNDKLHQPVVVLNGSLQYPGCYAPENAREFLFPVKTPTLLDSLLTDDAARPASPKPIPFSQLSHIYVVLYLETPIDKDRLRSLTWKPLHLQFDAR